MRIPRPLSWTICLLVSAALAACGGGAGDGSSVQASPAPSVSSPNADPVSGAMVQPFFHTAAVDLDEPDNSAAPHRSLALSGVDTKGLTRERLDDAMRHRAQAAGSGEAAPMASTTPITTYTPAQIRAAYGQAALPASTADLTVAEAAQLGAGQTIYVIAAKDDPNIAAELAAFNAKFGLPSCSTRTLAAADSLPLAAASATRCELVVAYTTSAGTLTDTAPAYDSGWATEIALDVQWAHATAPLARLVLIEAPEASVNGMLKAVALANNMGPGVVSMTFGVVEAGWASSLDGYFSADGMTYVAATGDSGSAVYWPAVSSKVVAVGGTTLSYNGGARSETTWTGSGGGISAYMAQPSYQSSTIGSYAGRAIADVAFNADPYSGQYVATIGQGSTTTRWASAGGTSLAAPQWAGLLAVANAIRVASSKALLGAPHAMLYQQIGAVPTQYAAVFNDVTAGSNGSCATCTATIGYDTPTGWGTPHVSALLSALGKLGTMPANGGPTDAPPADTPTPSGPTLTTTPLTGTAGKPFSGTIAYSAADPSTLNFLITGAAPGMTFTVNSSAIGVNWIKPVAGRTDLVITLTDKFGQTTTGTVTVIINSG